MADTTAEPADETVDAQADAPEAPVEDVKGPADELDWKKAARKHETRAKQTARELEEARRLLKEREDADKSEQEKAIEQAREQARTEALSQVEKERRADRLESSVTRLAARGFEDGDTVLKFADPDDAMVYLERAISRGDVDPEDIFDENGKVQTEAVTEALRDLLSSKPHLRARDEPPARVPGSSDAGRGSSSKGDESVEEILARKRRYPQH